MNTELVLTEPEPQQALIRLDENPAHLMRRATDVAGVSREIVMKTAVNIQGRKYVKVEGWLAIAVAHGCIASARDVERVETGYRAIGEVRRMADGIVLATAEGFVGDDEKTWGSRAEYAKRAMAQTRAISRVCRSAFAHVVVLIDSNLSTTPAEEMTFATPDETPEPEPPKPAKPAPAAKPAPKKANPVQHVMDAVCTELDKKALLDALYKLIPLPMRSYATEFFRGFEYEGKQYSYLMPNEGLDDLPADKLRSIVNNWTKYAPLIDAFVANSDQVPGAETPPKPINVARETEQDEEAMDDHSLYTKYSGTVDHVAVKEGSSVKGPWKRYGVKIDGEYYNSFDKKLGELAISLKGKMVRYSFDKGERGNDLTSLEAA